MYVCVCHGVTEDDVRGCVSDGACSAREVRQLCGMRPGCGSCVQRICALLEEPVRETARETVRVA